MWFLLSRPFAFNSPDSSLWHVHFLNRGEDSVLVWGEQTAVKVTGMYIDIRYHVKVT